MAMIVKTIMMTITQLARKMMTNMRNVKTIITVGCHLSKDDLEVRLQKGLRFKLRESQLLVRTLN